MTVLERMKKENLKRLKSFYKTGETSVMVNKALELGFELPNTTGAAISLGLSNLESEFLEGRLIDSINLQSNDKLNGIPTISFPNIGVQATFMNLVKLNPSLEKFESVRILMDYFKSNTVCKNCGVCCGLCYNNKFEFGKPKKALSELRTLLAYITEPEKLQAKILKNVKWYNTFRINANGEIHSREMLMFWINIAKQKKNTNFFTYTKSFELFEEYLEEKNLPKNLIVNMSLIEGQQEELKEKFPKLYEKNKFIIVDEIPNNAKNICCGDCSECAGYCMQDLRKNNNKIYVAYHN